MKNIKKLLLVAGWLCMLLVQAKAQAALNFDGTNDYVNLPYNSALNLTNGTIEMWARPTYSSLGNNTALIHGGIFNMFMGNARQKFFLQSGAGTVEWAYAFTQNQWVHLAVVVSGTTVELFVNGTSQGTKTWNFTSSTNAWRVGNSTANAEHFMGEMDELRIWNVARTQAQIQANRNCELLGGESGLVGYYRFNQSSGATLPDISGNANNATLNNFALTGSTSNWVATGGVTTGTFCTPGAGLSFDGTNDYVNLGNPTSLQLTTGTVEFWVKTNSTATNDVLVNKEGFYQILMLSSELKVYDAISAGIVVSTGINLANNAWRHIAMSFAPGANNSKLYVDGALVSTFTLSNAVNTGNLSISSSNAAQACVGTFDEMRIWNTVRTLAQIQASRNCELLGGESGLQAYYRFNQSSGTTLSDASGNGNNGTLTNFELTGNASNWVATGSVTTGTFCTAGAALNFDGTNDYVNCGTAVPNAASTFTLEAWVNPGAGYGAFNDPSEPQEVVSRWGAGGANNASYRFGINSAGKAIFQVFNNATGASLVTSTATVPINAWTHIAGTRESDNTLKIYVNGVLSGTTSSAVVPQTSTYPVYIGKPIQGNNQYKGSVDEVRIWNIARTAAQIQNSMNCELLGSESGLQAYYQFNQSSGVTLTDATSNGNNGTLTNFALAGATSNWVAPGGVTSGATCTYANISGTTPSCGSTVLTATGGATYLWSTGATTNQITVSTNGTYTVTATSSSGTTGTASLAVSIYTLPTAGISGTTTACDQVSLTATPSGMTNYAWSNGVGTAANTFTTSGTYTVTVTDANGCTASSSKVVTVNKATASISGTADGCDQVNLTAGPAGMASYAWTGGATGVMATFNTAGTYTVTVTDANGCIASAGHTIFNVAVSKTYYPDADGDGYGDSYHPVQSCNPLPGHVLIGLDCDDTNAAINPGAMETCDNIDNNCNGILIESSCPGSNAPVASECSSRSTVVVLTGKVFFNYGSFTNARNAATRSSLTFGQPVVGITIGDDLNVGFGFWTRFLLSPSAPTVEATQGDLPDRVQINWSADPLSPAASTYKIYRNGALLATVDNETFAFIDFNVLAGQFYTYEIAGVNQFGEGRRGSSLGFLNPNGVITGQVKSFSGNPVIGATVKLSPTIGGAVSFNGLSTIFTEYSPTFPRAKFTLSCWAKIGNGNPATENTGIFDLGSSSGKNWWLHAVTPANGSKGVKFGIGKNLTTKTEISYTLPDSVKNNWHYYAASYNGSSLLFYVDGELVGTAVGEIAADSTVLFIGKRSDEGGYFIGKVDELRFYNRQLAQTEIQMTMNQTVSASSEGLTSYWKFDEGTGSKGFDLTSNKVKSYLCGAEWTSDKPVVVNAGISDETGFYKIEGVNYSAGQTFTAKPYKNFYFNQSLEFNAANSTYADLTDFDLPDSSTVDITVKNFDFSSNQCLLSKQNGATTYFSLHVNAGNLVLEMGSSSKNWGALGMGFHRLSFVMKQTGSNMEVTFYKNGTLVGLHTFSGIAANFSGGSPWTLGAKRNAGGTPESFFTGLIDEAAFFSTLLPLPEIQTFANIGTNVAHPKLSSYFNLNEGSLTVLHDMGTALTGNGVINGASWSTVAAISETLPHDFTPSSRLVTLNPSNTSADGIDFTDQSTIPVSGYVRFENTNCFQKNVEILVNGQSKVPQIFSDADGKFIVDLEPGETVRLTPKFGNHTFYPAFWDLKSVSAPVSGILFRNQTKRKVVGQMAGNETCRKSVIPAGAVVKVKVATLNGCYEQVKTLTGSGKFVFDGVPPDSVTVAVIEHSNPIIYDFFQNLGGATLDLRNQNDTTDFIYLAPPQVELSPLPTNSCGDAMLELNASAQVIVKVFEEYDGGVCYLDSADLTINNGISDLSQFDTVMTGGQLKYKFKAGAPQIAAPHLKFLQVTAKAHDELATQTLSGVVLGRRARQTTFASTAPSLPTLILRDPPGDGSFSFMEAGESSCQTVSLSASSTDGTETSLTLSLGADLTTSVGIGAEVELEIEATADFGLTTNSSFNNLITNEMETCVTTTKTISTSENDAVVGSAGGADVYMGGAVNYIFGITDELKFDSATCSFVLDKGLVVFPDGFATTFVYSEYQILKVVIPNLYAIGDTASALRWKGIIDLNTRLKNEAVFSKNISFDAGVVYEESETTETTKTITNEWTQEFSSDFAQEYGLTVNGVGIGGGVTMSSSTSVTKANANTSGASRTVGYKLADDDLRDNFTVNIKKDKAYGTPVFETVSGQSACPWEPNTQPREEVQLTIDKNVAVNIAENDVAVFQLNLGNTSPSGETGFYFVELVPESNPNGATLAANGVDLAGPVLYQIPPNSSIPLTVTIGKGPVDYDYTGLRIAARSGCEFDGAIQIGIPREGIDPKFYKEVMVDVHFLEPCSPVDVTFPLQDWVFTNAMGNNLAITLGGYDNADPDLELIRVQYRRSQGDGAWINIAEIPKADLGSVFEIVQWPLPTSFKDGLYEIRAVTQCFSGALNPGISKVIKGRIEREPPEVFGTPQPADGVLSSGDEISIMFTEPIRCGELIQADFFANNNVGLYNTRTGDLIDAVITCSGDKITIVPNVPNKFIENEILRVEVDNIKDLAGNQFLHKSWEFVVDRNPVHWEGGKVKVTKYKEDKVTVTRRIVNEGGQATDYLIEGVPSWVRVYPLGGNLLPGASEEITFEFNDQLAYGRFVDTISINPPLGLEPLIVDCRVMCKSPEWGFDAPAYSQTMNFAVKLNIEGELSTDEEDIVAAFIDGQVRGTAKVQLLPTLPPLGTQYMAFLTVYGNEDDFNKPVHLEIWDASECLRYGQVSELFSFEADNVVGTVGTPQVIHTNSLVRRDISINNGWNWLSFNLDFPNPALNQSLVSLLHPENDLIKSQSGFAEYFGSDWLGSLTQLNNTGMFQFRADTPDTIQMIGTLIDPDSLSIPISSGWNWIGYIPNYSLPVSQALAGLTALNGDIIKGQTAFAQYLAGFGWLGSLQYLEAPKGYQLKISYPGTLTYPHQNLVAQTVDARGLPNRVQNHWNINPSAFEYSMTLIGMLQTGGQNATLEQHELGVFAGNELRGSATAIYVEPLHAYLFFLTTYSNTPGELLHFKLFNSASGQESDLVEHMYFSDNNHQGSIDAPFPFTLESSGLIEPSALRYFDVQPNPFANYLTIRFQCEKAQEVRIVITDATGRTVWQQKTDAVMGLNKLQWNAEPGSAGLYFVRLEGETETAIRKVVRQ